MNKRKTGILFFAVLAAALLTTAAVMQQEQQALAGKLIRLHVIANSDSEADQARKLQVRDAVLGLTEVQAGGREEAKLSLVQMLPEIQKAAEDCLRAQDCDDPVEVMLGIEAYPTRVYENFVLPAGNYQSLRIVIGEGKGQNWWCVVFPSICFRATMGDLEEAAQAAGFTDGEIRLITENPDGYTLKFKSWELLLKLKQLLFRRNLPGWKS